MTIINWRELPFTQAIRDITSKANKVNQDRFQASGEFPIVDQGSTFIAGYIDDASLVWKGELPVIIFGDHTRALKYVDFPFVLGADGAKVLLPIPDIWPGFAYYALLEREIPSAGYSRHFKFLKEGSVRFPPLPEQKRIAVILAKADRLRRLRCYALDLSDTYLQSVFLEMFGDPLINPMGWPRSTLRRLGKVVTGATPPSSGHNLFGGSVPFITPGDLEEDTLNTSRFLTMEGAEKSRTVRAGSTMVCCIGATIGKVDKAQALSAFNQQINAVEWGSDVDDDFGWMTMKLYSGMIASMGTSTTLPILKKSAFAEMAIPVPPMHLQKEFARIVHRFEWLRAQQREAERQAEHLFQTLLHQAFQGEL